MVARLPAKGEQLVFTRLGNAATGSDGGNGLIKSNLR